MKKIIFLTLAVLLWSSGSSVLTAAEEKPKEVKEEGNGVKLRVVAVNPSSEKSQKVPIKIYLPKEVIPDDIIEMGELKVGYDTEKSLYYAYSDGAELAPQETRVFEVRLEDVWRIKAEETDKIKTQTDLALKHLQNTEYFDKAKVIVDSIDRRLDEIVVKQNDDSVSREEHIGAFRVNKMVMEQVQQDIAILEKMLMHVGAPPSVEFLKDTIFEKKDDIDRITTWKLIFAILGFLGLLGVGFYLKWFLQLKGTRQKQGGKKKAASSAPVVSEHVEDSGGPRPIELEEVSEEVDIEKLMEPEDKDKREAG